MTTVPHSPASLNPQDAADLDDGAGRLTGSYEAFQNDMQEVQDALDARQHQADLAQRLDSMRCTDCGLVTSGSTIAGQDLNICDRCLVKFVLAHIGTALVDDVAAEWRSQVA